MKSLSTQGNFGFPFLFWTKEFSIGQIFNTKIHKKCCPMGILEVVVFRLFASCMKVQWINFFSPPIKLLESFILSIDGCSVIHPIFPMRQCWL